MTPAGGSARPKEAATARRGRTGRCRTDSRTRVLQGDRVYSARGDREGKAMAPAARRPGSSRRERRLRLWWDRSGADRSLHALAKVVRKELHRSLLNPRIDEAV